MEKNPYHVIKCRYVTEKTQVLASLHTNNSNPSVRKCDTPKFVFLVDKKATKPEIARAVEQIYSEKKIKVIQVNTITMKQKQRTVRGRRGWTAGYKKAIVTLENGDMIEEA